MARLFVDDRNAAEDLVQEAFIRLSRSLDRIQDEAKVGRVPPLDRAEPLPATTTGAASSRSGTDHRRTTSTGRPSRTIWSVARTSSEVLEALRSLPLRQRDCLVLRYYSSLGIHEIADDARPLAELGQDPPPAGPGRPRATAGGQSMSRLEDRLRDALHAGDRRRYEPAPDLFARVHRSVASRTTGAAGAQRWRVAGSTLLAGAAVLAAVLVLVTDVNNGECSWTGGSSKLLITALLVGIGPAGWARSSSASGGATPRTSSGRTPRTGKSFIVLTDVAYYLIFTVVHPLHGRSSSLRPTGVTTVNARASSSTRRRPRRRASC